MPANRSDSIKFLTLDETKRLFSIIKGKRDKAIFLIAYRHGLRASEVGELRTQDINWKQLRLRLYRKKGAHGGEYPMQPDEARTLKAYHPRT